MRGIGQSFSYVSGKHVSSFHPMNVPVSIDNVLRVLGSRVFLNKWQNEKNIFFRLKLKCLSLPFKRKPFALLQKTPNTWSAESLAVTAASDTWWRREASGGKGRGWSERRDDGQGETFHCHLATPNPLSRLSTHS